MFNLSLCYLLFLWSICLPFLSVFISLFHMFVYPFSLFPSLSLVCLFTLSLCFQLIRFLTLYSIRLCTFYFYVYHSWCVSESMSTLSCLSMILSMSTFSPSNCNYLLFVSEHQWISFSYIELLSCNTFSLFILSASETFTTFNEFP
jgi:hypothetical protein